MTDYLVGFSNSMVRFANFVLLAPDTGGRNRDGAPDRRLTHRVARGPRRHPREGERRDAPPRCAQRRAAAAPRRVPGGGRAMSERDGFGPGVPCWVDTWQPDAAAAAAFYAGLFGWETEMTDAPAGAT